MKLRVSGVHLQVHDGGLLPLQPLRRLRVRRVDVFALGPDLVG
jgi:hypothetical protein